MYLVALMLRCTFVFCRYSPELQAMLAENVYLTGGNLLYPGVKERVERELLAMRPFQSHFKVTGIHTYIHTFIIVFIICSTKTNRVENI